MGHTHLAHVLKCAVIVIIIVERLVCSAASLCCDAGLDSDAYTLLVTRVRAQQAIPVKLLVAVARQLLWRYLYVHNQASSRCYDCRA